MVDKVALPDSPDREIARFAAAQHGVVTTAQLVASGLSRAAISKRVRSGRLHPMHRGVYALGHSEPGLEGRWHAAVLACGAGAVLSHCSAAAHWRLLRPRDGLIDVSIRSQFGRARRRDIRIHRCASLAGAAPWRADDEPPIPATTVREGIPVTAPWRTIDDLRRAAADPRDQVTDKLCRRAVREAELRRYALSPQTPRDRTRSDVERDFLALFRRHGLPAPEVNVRVGRWTVDFLWRDAGLVVEVDTWGTHGGSVAFEDDRQRDLGLRRLGLAVHRYTDELLETTPELVVAELRGRLGAAPGRLI